MNSRIIGFDIARAYAIFGMYIVNFNFCFGSFNNDSVLNKFLNVFIGNSTSIFIILAGIGVSIQTKKIDLSLAEKTKLKSIIIKRSWFLFILGIALYNWWPGDILHFYGGYLHIAALVLFIPKKYYLWIGLGAILIFHTLLFIIPINTSWNFETFAYKDFWTIKGFLRNTFYNGWNAIFPWLFYFMLGMFLGKLNWQKQKNKTNILCCGIMLLLIFEAIRFIAKNQYFSKSIYDYIMSDYFPPYIPFVMITTGFALIVISICMFIGDKFHNASFLNYLSKTGQMTLSHYVSHITFGMILLSALSNKKYTGLLQNEMPISSIKILVFAVFYFLLSMLFSNFWLKKFSHGPLEILMRKISISSFKLLK